MVLLILICIRISAKVNIYKMYTYSGFWHRSTRVQHSKHQMGVQITQNRTISPLEGAPVCATPPNVYVTRLQPYASAHAYFGKFWVYTSLHSQLYRTIIFHGEVTRMGA